MESVWGVIIGGGAGLALGGPIGALVGAAAGFAVDRVVDYAAFDAVDTAPEETVAFTIAVVALSAKMARADGAVSRDEFEAFGRVFTVPPEEAENVRFVFDLARRTGYGFDSYARQVAKLFEGRPARLEDLLGGLFYIATSDTALHPAEDAYLREVARIFGFDEAAYLRIRSLHVGEGVNGIHVDPYRILGVEPTASDAAVRSAWLQLVRENHPDIATAQGLPKEFVGISAQKLARINAAWDEVKAARGLG